MSNFNETECSCGGQCACHDNNIHIMNIGGEEIHFNKKEMDHFNTLPINKDDTNWKEKLIESGDYTTLVNALFTMNKIDDAWEIIQNNMNNINFNIIFNSDKDNPCPFFQIKRDAQDVYKYLYNENIIDDISYAYFQVIGGKLFDINFWKEFMSGKTVTDKFRTIHECYNGTNPFELGLIVLDDESWNFMLDGITEDEKLDDFIIGPYPGIFFDINILLKLMGNKNLNYENYPKYFGIILQMFNTDLKDFDDNDITVIDTYNSFWDTAYNVLNSRIKEINVNDIESLKSFINSDTCKSMIEFIKIKKEELKEIGYDNDDKRIEIQNKIFEKENIIQTLLINSLAFMNYPYFFKTLIESKGYINSDGRIPIINAVDCIFEDNYSYILSYKLLDFVNCDGFIIKYPFPAIMNCVYNTKNNMIFINGELKPYDESNLSEFLFAYDYLYSHTINDEIFKKCQSIEEYEELVYAIKHFNDDIQTFLN